MLEVVLEVVNEVLLEVVNKAEVRQILRHGGVVHEAEAGLII